MIFRTIPDGWEIKKMPQVVKWGSGGTPKATEKQYYDGGSIPWLVIGDLNDSIVSSSASKITELGLQNSSAKMIPAGTLLVAMYGSIGKLGITGIECCTNQAIAYAKELHGVTTKYMFFYMAMMKSELISKGKGGTQKNISQTVLNSLEVIVPPLPEQERIVARIEELFSQLDAGVETLKKTKAQLAVYRQAVLKEAFESVIPESDTCNVKDVCKDIKVGIVIKPAQYYTSADVGVRAFRSANVREFAVNDSDWVYLTKAGHEANLRSEIHTGDVLVVRSGYPGTACVVPPTYNGCNAIDILIAVPYAEKILPEYLCAYTNSPLGKRIIQEKKRGVAQAHFNVSGYSKTPIIVPCLETQKRVVAEIDSRLSVCDSIEQTVDTALQQAEAMRQSILKDAFEGRL